MRWSFILFITQSVCTINLTYSANILGIFPNHAVSHSKIFLPLMEQLAIRGHNVDVVSHFPRKTPLNRYTDLSLKGSIQTVRNFNSGVTYFVWDLLDTCLKQAVDHMCKAAMNTTMAKRLKNSKKKYDVIIAQINFSSCVYGYAEIFKVPLILIANAVSYSWTADIAGVSNNPSYIPNVFSGYTENMSFLERLHNAMLLVLTKFWWYYRSIPRSGEYYKDFFENAKTDIREVLKKSTLLMVNSHFSIHQSRPMTPDFIEIAGIHIKPNQTIPRDFEKHLVTNQTGIIYLSFGTLINTLLIPEKKLADLFQSLGKLPYKILWQGDPKIRRDQLEVPENIHFIPWTPQLALLCDPKVSLFISHGGLAGVIESIHCGKPMLIIPIWADQHSNAHNALEKKFARVIAFDDLTEKRLTKELAEVLSNSEYKENAEMLSKRFYDRPMSPMDTAVYWTEYVMRNKGAPYLRSKVAQLPWYTYCCLDIIVIPLLLIFVMVLTFLKIANKLNRSKIQKIKKF